MIPFYDRGGITLYNADARDLLNIAADVILTDPPNELAGAFDRPEMHVLVNVDTLPVWLRRDDLSAVTVWRRPTRTKHGYASDLLLHFGADPEMPFVLDEGPRETDHPAERGLVPWTRLLGRLPGRTVLDPFAGSGTTLVAAQTLGRRAIGIERDLRFCLMAAERLTR